VFHADVSLAAVVFGVCICVYRDVLCDDRDAAVSGVAAIWVRVNRNWNGQLSILYIQNRFGAVNMPIENVGLPR
jgi:hypothetical protein